MGEAAIAERRRGDREPPPVRLVALDTVREIREVIVWSPHGSGGARLWSGCGVRDAGRAMRGRGRMVWLACGPPVVRLWSMIVWRRCGWSVERGVRRSEGGVSGASGKLYRDLVEAVAMASPAAVGWPECTELLRLEPGDG